MDIGSVAQPGAVDAIEALASALAEAAVAEGEALVALAPVPGNRADHNVETATMQALARPPAHGADAQRGGVAPHAADNALPSSHHAASGFAIPADQLVPVALTSLQVDAGGAWALTAQPNDVPLPESPRRQAVPPPPDDVPPEHVEHGGDEEAAPADDEAAAGLRVEAEPEDDWCEPLTRALRDALAAQAVPASLLGAAEQWRRGRCVVLACPQGRDPAGAAWAFVLRPRSRAPRRLDLHGVRVAARLQWSTLPPPVPWCHGRVVKEHHPRRGRQLVPLDAAGLGPVACEVQLGPVLGRALRRCVVCLRVDAVRRFWSALDTQWSATIVVCSRALGSARANPMEPSC
jgi:hypothetical protein